MDKNIPDKAFTHAGKFHSDDVFSAALLTYLNPEIQIERGFLVPENYDGIVFDIGFGKYDHHQRDARVRLNGVPYAAFGLLFDEFGLEILNKEDAEKFDEKFIQPLDLSDNTGCDNDIAKIISMYNPNWNENATQNDRFEEAKNMALGIISRYFKQIESVNKASNIVMQDMVHAKDGILILKHYVPWKKAVKGTDINFVLYHSQRGGFCAQAVSDDEGNMKHPFPDSWCGKEGEELEKVSGIKGLSFCHKSGFLLTGETLDILIEACKK